MAFSVQEMRVDYGQLDALVSVQILLPPLGGKQRGGIDAKSNDTTPAWKVDPQASETQYQASHEARRNSTAESLPQTAYEAPYPRLSGSSRAF